MELFRNIFFNTDKIIEGTDVRVTYAGYLFQNGAQNVWVHMGYDENWNNSQDIQMSKTALGYQADICVGTGSTLNFCFKNENGEWDNNEGQNYIVEIEPQPEIIDAIVEQNTNVDDFVPEEPIWETITAGTTGNPCEEITPNESLNQQAAGTAGSVYNETITTGVAGNIYNKTTTAGATENLYNNVTENTTEKNENNSLCEVSPTWTQLIKRTFNNFINYITRLFSGNKENAKENNK